MWKETWRSEKGEEFRKNKRPPRKVSYTVFQLYRKRQILPKNLLCSLNEDEDNCGGYVCQRDYPPHTTDLLNTPAAWNVAVLVGGVFIWGVCILTIKYKCTLARQRDDETAVSLMRRGREV